MAFKLGFEEVLLIDVKLVVKPIDIVRLDGLFKVLEWFQVGYFSEPQHIVVKELHSAGWPSDILVNNHSDRLSIDSSEVDGDYSVLFQVLRTVAVNVVVNDESILNSDPFHAVFSVLKVERFDFSFLDEFKLEGVKVDWIFSIIQSKACILTRLIGQCFPSFGFEFLVFIVSILEG